MDRRSPRSPVWWRSSNARTRQGAGQGWRSGCLVNAGSGWSLPRPCQRTASVGRDSVRVTLQSPSLPTLRDPLSGVRRLAFALAVTRIGATAAYVAVAVQIWRLTHSAAWDTAALLLTFGVGGVLPLLTSPVADRFDRRRVMVLSQLAVATTWIALAAWHSPTGLVVLGLVSAVAESPFFVAVEAAVPSVAAALLISRVGGPFREAARPDEEPRTGSALAGLRVLMTVPLLRRLTLGWTVAMLGFQGANVVFAPLAEMRGAGPVAYAGWLTAWGAGLAAGSLLGRRLTAATELRGLALSLIVAGTGLVGMGLAPTPLLVGLTTAVAGIGFGLSFVADAGLVQRSTPDAVRARTRAVYDGIVMVSGLMSMVLAGALLAVVGPTPFFVLGGLAVVTGSMVLLAGHPYAASREQRRVRADAAR